MNKTTIVVELDGVIADTSARQELMKEDWNTYHDACDTDIPNEPFIQILNSLSNFGYEILVVTGRPARFDKKTIDWLNKHKIEVSEVLMRPEMDYRDEVSVKLDLLADYFGSLEEAKASVVVGFEARDRTIEGLRAHDFEIWGLR